MQADCCCAQHQRDASLLGISNVLIVLRASACCRSSYDVYVDGVGTMLMTIIIMQERREGQDSRYRRARNAEAKTDALARACPRAKTNILSCDRQRQSGLPMSLRSRYRYCSREPHLRLRTPPSAFRKRHDEVQAEATTFDACELHHDHRRRMRWKRPSKLRFEG